MERRAGIQSEVLVSLALVMLLATLVLAGVVLAHQEASLRRVLGRALLAEARRPVAVGDAFVPGTEWWTQAASGLVEARGVPAGPPDAASRALAQGARVRGVPLLEPGLPWERIRFAAPIDGRGTVALARLPEQASVSLRLESLWVVGGVLLANVVIFSVFGATLLGRRVVRPLQNLAGAARAFGRGESGAQAVVEGPRETAEVARAFNEMSETLARRAEALEKAVAELRGANRDLRRAHAGLDRAERLASVGRLAAGVAHEIGNPIGAILALLDLAGRDPGLSDATREHIERGQREGERVRGILRQLLDFSSPRRPSRVAVELGELAREALALVSAQRRYAEIRFELVIEEGTPAALADPGTVTQILLNLLLNAADAARDGDAGRVQIRVRSAALATRAGDADAAGAEGRQGADAVECEVADDGPGIDESDRERIFDPFFTTKPPGEGTGLGLANAARAAEELEGGVELAPPPPGLRTAFRLRLPASEQGAPADAPEPRSGVRSPQAPA